MSMLAPAERALSRWENEGGAVAHALREQFPGVGDWHYLDTAATAQKPQVVLDAMTRAGGEDYATVHRGVYARSANMTLAYEAARRRVAAFLGGREEEIVFTRGATEAINLVAQCYPGIPGKSRRVLLSTLEHHSNIVPWQLAGWQVDVCPLTTDGRIDLDAAEAMLSTDFDMIALAHVSNVLGSVLDVPRAAALSRKFGASLLLDGCQAVPRMPVDVAALGCDFYVFSAHKLYGPTGIGALWGRKPLLAALPPMRPHRRGLRQVRQPSSRPSASLLPSIMSRQLVWRPSTRTKPNWSARRATHSVRSIRLRSTARMMRQALFPSQCKGCIRTTSAPYWTKKAWRSALATTAHSR
jgi:cysteine desulfurase / selenocysteine lyase